MNSSPHRPSENVDPVLVVGSGIAGLVLALAVADAGHQVVVVTKAALERAEDEERARQAAKTKDEGGG